MRLSLDRREIYGSAGEPRTLQIRQCGAADEQCADARRMAEHFVERERHEIRLHGRKVQAAGGHEGGRIEQHAPSFALRFRDNFERMLHAGKIGLRRISKQIGVGRIGLVQQSFQACDVQPQFGHHQRRVGNAGAFGAREFANSIHGVVIVESEQVTAARRKGKGFAHELERRRGVLREDQDVIFGAGVEVGQNVTARALDVIGRRGRRRISGMRIA